jgi:pimeloyl-ACP methyl ester carboxylesterase
VKKQNLLRITAAIGVLAWLGYAQFKPGIIAAAPLATASASAASASATPAQTRKLGTLEFAPCTLAPKLSTEAVEAQCTTLAVPEDYAHPSGRKIQLALAWVPAKNEQDPDPVFMLAGGPGQSARDSYPQIARAFEETLKKRSVFLLDQRGTGGSHPLRCRDTSGRNTVSEDQTDDSPEAIRRFTEACRDQLSRDSDLRFYTTTDAIRDLDAVRAAIGAAKINLVGISYGTRVAQQYARRYPQRTRTVVLDSVAPNELILGNEFARNLEDALDANFHRCQLDAHCNSRMGNPREHLDALLAQLKAAPVPVTYRDPLTGELLQEPLTRGSLAVVARLYAYVPMLAASLPLTLSEAARGRYEPLMAQARMMSSALGDSIMVGMQLSVMCAEDADGLRADPAYADSVLGNALIDVLRAQCAVWPKGARPADFHQPFKSDLPVLVLEGEFDPVTPPRYGREVVKNLSNGRLLVLRGQGHNVIPIGCMPRLLARFIDTADAKMLDARCLDKLPYSPPFTSYNGWDP